MRAHVVAIRPVYRTYLPFVSYILWIFTFRFDNGTTFVVKDIEKFAAEVIPAYFKHSNFSSFVRQLNFYGFRKIKSSSLRINEDALSAENKYWKFHHKKFQMGRPDLVAEIRKGSSETGDNRHEVENLKSEVKNLKDDFVNMNQKIDNLTRLVQSLLDIKIALPDWQSGKHLSNSASMKRKAAAPCTLSAPSEATMLTDVSAARLQPPSQQHSNMEQLGERDAVRLDDNKAALVDVEIKKEKVDGELQRMMMMPLVSSPTSSTKTKTPTSEFREHGVAKAGWDWEPPPQRSAQRSGPFSVDDDLIATFFGSRNGDGGDSPPLFGDLD